MAQGVLTSTTPLNASAPTWPELLGSGHWSGLLDPLDETLLGFLLLCGDLCQVTYDAFDADQNSRYCGSCRFAEASLLRRVLFPAAADIAVARYLYATSSADLPLDFLLFSLSREAWSKESNWIGYVAVSTDAAAAATGRRVIYVAWRGTIRSLEWVDVVQPVLVDMAPILSDEEAAGAKVMKGWHVIYTSSDERSPFTGQSAREQLLAAVRQLIEHYAGENISVVTVGHSLGAALATLSAFDLVVNGVTGDFPVAAVGFGSPQVGNREFKELLESLPTLRVLRVKNRPDTIPLYPSGILGFEHVGDELVIDSGKSPFLKPKTTNVGDYHNLQAMLHTVAGWRSDGEKEFALRVPRSVALVNKSCGFLAGEQLVPESWWVEKNKGMALGEDGEWRLVPPPDEVLPPAAPVMLFNRDAPVTVVNGGDGGVKKKGGRRRRGLAGLLPCFSSGDSD